MEIAYSVPYNQYGVDELLAINFSTEHTKVNRARVTTRTKTTKNGISMEAPKKHRQHKGEAS